MKTPTRTKPALPHDYLDDQIPVRAPAPKEERDLIPRPNCVRATFHLPYELVEECRDTVVALSGPPLHLTMAKLVRTALRPRLKQLRDEFNGGDRFPRRGTNLPGGRPLRSQLGEEERG